MSVNMTKVSEDMKTGEQSGARTCPSCGARALERELVRDRFEYGGEGDPVWVEADNVPVEVCRACGQQFSGPEAARIRHDAICRALGLLTPAEIRELRERFGMTQEQFADWTGIGVATISRWERGRWVQTRAHDRFLRTLDENRILHEVVDAVPAAKRALLERQAG
jgi:putative zinc finger/helix-turn-helix YgiT family protein